MVSYRIVLSFVKSGVKSLKSRTGYCGEREFTGLLRVLSRHIKPSRRDYRNRTSRELSFAKSEVFGWYGLR